jgi:hypothetical protein
MQLNFKKSRSIALLTGGVLAASALMPMTPAHADKSKTYKAGAAILGAAGALMILKGKTLPGVLAGAGAYYAYKQGQKAKDKERYGQYQHPNNDPRYSQYPDTNSGYYDNSGTYDNRSNTGYYDNRGTYDNTPTYDNRDTYDNRGGYSNSNDPYYGGTTSYPSDRGYNPGYQGSSTGSNTYPDYGYRAFKGNRSARRVVK